MKDNPELVTRAHFDAVMKEFIQRLFHLQADAISLHTVLIDSGVLTEAQILLAREKVQRQMKTALDNRAETTPEKLLEALRKFGGPPQ